MLPFSPQLVGQTEKTFGAALRRALAPHDLTADEWVILRLAGSDRHGDPLAQIASDRAHLEHAGDLVAGLRRRGLVVEDDLTTEGATAVATVAAGIDALTAPVFAELDRGDVTATERVLNAVFEGLTARLRSTDAVGDSQGSS